LINAWNSAYTHVSDAVRHITSAERSLWNSKETPTGAQAKADIAESKANAYTDIHDADTTKHITSEERTDWDDTSSKKHEHSNKTVLDTITELIINGWDSAVEHISDLVKHITSDERTKWNAVTNKADITYVDEELNNKAASVHGHVKADITDFPNLSNVATSGSYNDLSNKPTIPTDTNQLAKTDVYTKTEVDNKLGSAGYGDMMKAVYDTDEDGTVDKADIANTLKVSETKKITIEGGIGTIPDDAVNSPVSLTVKGNTWMNRAGAGDTSPQTVENLDSTKTYLLINSLGKNVTIDTVDTATPKKLTGATSYVFEWTEGKIALYELSATEAALTEAVLGARYNYVDGTKSTLSGRLKKIATNKFNKNQIPKARYTAQETILDTGLKVKSTVSGMHQAVEYSLQLDPSISQYTFSVNISVVSGGAYAMVQDSVTKAYITAKVSSGVAAFATPSHGKIDVLFYCTYIANTIGEVNYTNILINGGATASPYVEYSEQNVYYTGTYRSLPNGTKDEVRLSEGKLIKRIGEKTNVASGAVINYADMADNGTYYAWNDDGETETGVKGDTLGIDATELIYQLAEPVVTKIPPQILTAKAGDTIMWIPDSNPKDTTTPEMEVEYVVDMGGAVNKLVDTAQHLNERAGMHTDDISELQIKTDAHDSDYIKHPIVGTTKGSSTAYTLSPDPPLDELVIGVGAIITAHLASGDNPTLNISGKGAKPIIKPNENPAKLLENGVYHVRYNGVNFILLGEGGEYGTAQTNHVLAPYTIGTEDGIVEGTMPDRGSKIFTPSDSTQTGADGYYSGITVNPRPVLSGDAATADVRTGKTFYKDSYTKLTGTIPNNTAMNSTITTQGGQIVVPQGYHPDGGVVKANFANLIAGNVKSGVNIGGVVGNLSGLFNLSTANETIINESFSTPNVNGNAEIYSNTLFTAPSNTKLITIQERYTFSAK
jgi:hypothetical protein